VRVEGRRPEGPDADWVHLPDPIADALKGLSSRIAAVEEVVGDLSEREGADVRPLRPAVPPEDPGARASSRLGPNPAGG
jgi:serine O-acetyltransferase